MTIKILIMGLPGSGKTTFAEKLKYNLEILNKSVDWFNADQIRMQFDDWDFSLNGRIRQSVRMADLAQKSKLDYVLLDFVAPLPISRYNVSADWVIWMDTIESGRFEDTNKLFENPVNYDFRITEQNAEYWSNIIADKIANNIRNPVFDYKKETVQMLGRFQPWHAGHRALFERSLKKTGQVCIMVRDCQGWNKSNPFNFVVVRDFIKRDLDPKYQGTYEIVLVPNIVNITYGRDVGYKIEQEVFDDAIHSISATKIRKNMGLE